MRILVAPGSFKGTLKSIEATDAIACGFSEILPDASINKLVLADGGEGTLEAFGSHFGSKFKHVCVRGPLGAEVVTTYALLSEDVALVESCQAIGHSLIRSSEMNPFAASSCGLGELIRHVITQGVRTVMISMGDSVTLEMGIGMLQALGVRFFSASGTMTNVNLHTLADVVDFDDSSLDDLRHRITFVGLVDTNDYLCGEAGQVQLYGQQKGLRQLDIPRVEAAFINFAQVIHRRLDIDVTTLPRATGSGGVAAALHAFLGATLHNTLDFLATQVNVEENFPGADLVITGEGRLDSQTKFGKVPFWAASRAPQHCICLVGSYTDLGLSDLRQVCPRASIFSMNPELSMRAPKTALRELAASLARMLLSGGI